MYKQKKKYCDQYQKKKIHFTPNFNDYMKISFFMNYTNISLYISYSYLDLGLDINTDKIKKWAIYKNFCGLRVD